MANRVMNLKSVPVPPYHHARNQKFVMPCLSDEYCTHKKHFMLCGTKVPHPRASPGNGMGLGEWGGHVHPNFLKAVFIHKQKGGIRLVHLSELSSMVNPPHFSRAGDAPSFRHVRCSKDAVKTQNRCIECIELWPNLIHSFLTPTRPFFATTSY